MTMLVSKKPQATLDRIDSSDQVDEMSHELSVFPLVSTADSLMVHQHNSDSTASTGAGSSPLDVTNWKAR